MKNRSTFVYILGILGVLAVASMLMAMSSAGAAPQPAAAANLQETVIVSTPPIGVTPPVVVVTGTAGVIPGTGDGTDTTGGSWLFLAILVVAGLAFLVAIFALMRRPYP